jgi:hypothetical protein
MCFSWPVLVAKNPTGRAPMTQTRYDKLAITLIVLGLFARTWLAYSLNTSNDEAYAIAVAREATVSFFDHPPIAFWLAGLAADFFGEHAIFYRIPFLIIGTGTIFFLWQIARNLGGARVGLWAVMLWHFTPHMLTGSGVFAVPEGPLNLFCVGALWVLSFDLAKANAKPRAKIWLAAGGFLAFAFASKYNAGLFGLAVFVFLLVDKWFRGWLACWQPWAGAAVGLIGTLPVIIFGFQTDWASFRFHSGRTGAAFDLGNLATMYLNQASQLAYLNMIVLVGGLWYGFRAPHPMARLIAWVSAIGMLFFAPTYAFGTYTHSHWTMPAWLMAIPLGALWICSLGKFFSGFRGIVGLWWAFHTSFAAFGFYEMATGRLTEAAGKLMPILSVNKMYDLSPAAIWLNERGGLQNVTVIGVDDWESGGRVSTMLGGQFDIKSMGTDPRHFQFHRAFADSRPSIFIQVGTTPDLEILDREAATIMRAHGAQIIRTEYLDILHGGFPLVTVAVRRLAW